MGLIKFLDLFDFKENFNETFIAPDREPKLGHYFMVLGILMLMFIGFNRIWHFIYIRLDAMLCGILRVQLGAKRESGRNETKVRFRVPLK